MYVIIKILSPFFNFKFATFDQKMFFFLIFEKLKIIKAQAGIELMANRFVVNALTQCALNNTDLTKESYFGLAFCSNFVSTKI